MKRAALYARRSTAEQDRSVEGQINACEAHAVEVGLEVVARYDDTASGWKPDTPRPGFDKMLGDAVSGAFDVLVVWEISRLSRQADSDSALAMVWNLRKLGVEVRSVIEPSTGVALADDIAVLLKSHAAKEESDTKSKRVTRGKRQGVLAGVHQGAWAPYGYADGGRGHTADGRSVKLYAPHPEHAAVAREIVQRYVDGATPQEIADALNGRGVSPPTVDGPDRGNHPQARRGRPEWHQSTLRSLIGNPLLAGFASYKGRRVKGCSCAGLADAATWDTWDTCPHPWVRSANVAGGGRPCAVGAGFRLDAGSRWRYWQAW